MRPSRTQLELLLIACLGSVLYLVPRLFDISFDVTLSMGYALLADVTVVAVALGYSYHAGKTGRVGSPRTVVREYLVAALVGFVVLAGGGLFLTGSAISVDLLGAVMFVRIVVDQAVPFVLAGLAGVPLGAMGAVAGETPASNESDTTSTTDTLDG